MFRRRTPAPPSADPAPAVASGPTLDQLRADGWVLPKGIDAGQRGSDPAWTLVGTVGSPVATAVDPAGLVVGEGWSLDWWIGADDRWHVPSQSPTPRQVLIDDVPVVETLVRIPGGDAVQRVYGIRSPRGTGDEWVVVEIENRTPVPFGVALAVRPFVADGRGSVERITVEPVAGGSGRDEAHLIRGDGRPSVVLPRRPSRSAAGDLAGGDVAAVVTAGEARVEIPSASCPDGMATLAVVYPLAHTAVLRLVLPVGQVDPAEAIGYPSVIPDAATVASGWEVHRRGPRFELPERRLQVAVERARTQIHLAHDGEAVHRDGNRGADLDPGATEVLLNAFDALDRPADVGTVVARWTDRLADPSPEVDALVLRSVAVHWLLHRVDALLDWMLPEVAAAVERLDRADRRGRLADPVARGRAVAALRSASDLFAASGQGDAAKAVAKLTDRIDGGGQTAVGPDPADRLVDLARRLASGDLPAAGELDVELAAASLTGTWPGPGRGTRRIGHDLAAAAAVVLAARSMLIAEQPDGLAMLPVFPGGWYGGGVEVHDAPTTHGRLSYAIRWHGQRPALLWDFVPHDGAGAVRLSVPGLDPTWSTTELRGDALLAEVAPPEGFDLVREVAEHPDIDPAMRKPGDEPEPPAEPLPESGTFS